MLYVSKLSHLFNLMHLAVGANCRPGIVPLGTWVAGIRSLLPQLLVLVLSPPRTEHFIKRVTTNKEIYNGQQKPIIPSFSFSPIFIVWLLFFLIYSTNVVFHHREFLCMVKIFFAMSFLGYVFPLTDYLNTYLYLSLILLWFQFNL